MLLLHVMLGNVENYVCWKKNINKQIWNVVALFHEIKAENGWTNMISFVELS